MNKNFIQKIFVACTLVLFGVGGVNAQILTDYEEATVGVIDSVTVNSTTRLYVYPDPVFSPTYNAVSNTNLGTDQRWSWDIGAANVKPNANENWLEYTWGSTGTQTITVVETNNSITCVGSNTTIDVEVIDAPTVVFTVADATPVFGSSATHSYCEGTARLGTDYPQATFTTEVSGTPSFQIDYDIAIDTSDDGGTTWTNIAALDQDYTGASGLQESSNTNTHNLQRPAGGFVAIANGDGIKKPTRYTYSINGVNDRISRKSNYLTNSTKVATAWSWYDTGGKTLSVFVYPTPVTGPIYKISNLWAN